MEFGTTKGLAYVHNWEAQAARTMSLFEADQKMAAQTKAEAEKMAQDFTLGKVYTDRGRQKLGEFSNETFSKIGEFAAKNKNWQYDPVLRGQMKMLTNSLRDNDIVSAEENSEQGRQQMIKDMANPDNGLDQYDFLDMKNRYENYKLTGNQSGKIDGTTEAFTYFAPKAFDAAAAAKAILDLTESKTTFSSDGMYNYSTQTRTPEALHSAATNALAGPDGKRWQREFERGKAKGLIADPDAHSMMLRMFSNYNGDTRTKEVNQFALENLRNRNSGGSGDTEDPIINPFDLHVLEPLSTTGKAITQDMSKLYNTVYDKEKPTLAITGSPRLKSARDEDGKYHLMTGLQGRNVRVMYGNEIQKSPWAPGVYEGQVTMLVKKSTIPTSYFDGEAVGKKYSKDIRLSATEKDVNGDALYEVDTYMEVPKFTPETQMRYNAEYMEKKNNMKVAVNSAIDEAALQQSNPQAYNAYKSGKIITAKNGNRFRVVLENGQFKQQPVQ
jgi:hypothetical protein